MRNWTFGQLLATSSRLANALAARGVAKGDRVAVFLSQGAELTLCHLAGYRMGAVVLPLFTLFGEEALEYRLANAEASAVITDMASCPRCWRCATACRTSDHRGHRRRRSRPPTSSTGTAARRGVGQLRHPRHRGRGTRRS